MIRLGSLAGYPFEGPRVLGGFSPTPGPGVFAILLKSDPVARPEEYAVIYVGTSDDLAGVGLPFNHPDAPGWIARAGGDRWKLFVCTYQLEGSLPGHREQIAQELCAVYRPSCNEQQYDATWRREWIGDYSAPTTGPLTTPREPGT